MEDYRLHKLLEDGVQIGGAIIELPIGAVNGPLNTVSVKPVPEEEQVNLEFIRLQVADRVVWMDFSETENLINLLKLAYNAAKSYYT